MSILKFITLNGESLNIAQKMIKATPEHPDFSYYVAYSTTGDHKVILPKTYLFTMANMMIVKDFCESLYTKDDNPEDYQRWCTRIHCGFHEVMIQIADQLYFEALRKAIENIQQQPRRAQQQPQTPEQMKAAEADCHENPFYNSFLSDEEMETTERRHKAYDEPVNAKPGCKY
jgi:plasmid stabilization system protein ParE